MTNCPTPVPLRASTKWKAHAALVLALGLTADPSVGLSSTSWLRDPALSPDGKFIAFRADGDLFVAPTHTGKAWLLQGTTAREHSPKWLSDGRRIAFASNSSGNDDVFVVDSRNRLEPVRLTWHSRDEVPVGVSPDGESLLVRSGRLDLSTSQAIYPMALGGREDRPSYSPWTSIFSVPLKGGFPLMLVEANAFEAAWTPDAQRLVFSASPSTEGIYRKHDRSPATSDIWTDATDGNTVRRLTTFDGHDTTPQWNDADGWIYFLSERSGSFNIWRMPATGDRQARQVTHHARHPVRGLTVARSGDVAYSFHGELYFGRPGERFRRLPIQLPNRQIHADPTWQDLNAAVRQAIPGPGDSEVILVTRGEMYVVVPGSNLSRTLLHGYSGIKSWPSLSADGRRLLVVRDRGDVSDLLLAQLPKGARSWLEEGHNATVVSLAPTRAEVIIRAALSPNGLLAAYTTGRALRLVDTVDKTVAELLSASEGLEKYDQPLAWHPDSRHLAIQYRTLKRDTTEIAILSTQTQGLFNVSQSGFDDTDPHWSADGRKLFWNSDRDGARASWASESMNDAYELLLDLEGTRDAVCGTPSCRPATSGDVSKWIETLRREPDQIRDRRERLTITSGTVRATGFSPSGQFLLQLREVGTRSELWKVSSRTHQQQSDEQLLVRLPGEPQNGKRPLGVDPDAISLPSIHILGDERAALLVSRGVAYRIDLQSGGLTQILLSSVSTEDPTSRHRWIFDHVARTVDRVYYRPEFLPRVRWPDYVAAYRKLVPAVRDPGDFAELMNEFLGELQSSHTYFRFEPQKERVRSGSLELVYDTAYRGLGWKIAEVLPGSPLRNTVRADEIIAAINGVPVDTRADPAQILLNTVGQSIRLRIISRNHEGREVTAVPISNAAEAASAYRRWANWQNHETERLSHGRLGYVHMATMSEQPFRALVEDVLGRHIEKDGIVFDTRFNQGGWMHEPLMAFLSAPYFFDLKSMGRIYASEPALRAGRPVILLINAANFSNGSEVPRLAQEHGVAKLVGEPYAGTGLGGHSEPLPYPEYIYSVAHDTCLTPDGQYWENKIQQPDFVTKADRSSLRAGRDRQLESAVNILLEELH